MSNLVVKIWRLKSIQAVVHGNETQPSVKTGTTHEISSFKWQKYLHLFQVNWIVLLTEHLSQYKWFVDFSDILFALYLALPYLYGPGL